MDTLSMYIKNRFLFSLLIVLLVFMPYSTFVLQATRHLLEVNGVDIGNALTLLSVGWKELLLGLLGIGALAHVAFWKKVPFPIHGMDWVIIGFTLYGILVGGFIVGELKPVIFGIRYDFAVFFFYFIARLFKVERPDLERVMKMLLIASIPLLIFAILQVAILPHTFLERFGYSWGDRISGNPLPPYHFVGDGLLRAMATFPGPNSLAMYTVFLLILLVFFGKNWLSKTWWLVGLCGISIPLLLTYSRGHVASFLMAMVLFGFLGLEKVHKTALRMQVTVISFVLLALSFSLYISVADFSGINNTSKLGSLLLHNTSSEIHRNVRTVAWESIQENPWGTGLGTSGLATTNTGGEIFNPESWYIQITQELGWLGLILALAVISSMYVWMVRMYSTFPDPRDQRVVKYFIVSFTSIVISAQFLPCWFEVASITWWVLFGFFIGDFDRSFGVVSLGSATSKKRMQVEIE